MNLFLIIIGFILSVVAVSISINAIYINAEFDGMLPIVTLVNLITAGFLMTLGIVTQKEKRALIK